MTPGLVRGEVEDVALTLDEMIEVEQLLLKAEEGMVEHLSYPDSGARVTSARQKIRAAMAYKLEQGER